MSVLVLSLSNCIALVNTTLDLLSPDIIDNSLAYLQPQCTCQRGWHSIPYLSVFVANTSFKYEIVPESLASGTFPDRYQTWLVRVNYLALLPQRLGISDGCFKKSVPRYPAIRKHPVGVPVSCVRKGPGNESRALLVIRITRMMSLLGGERAATNSTGS